MLAGSIALGSCGQRVGSTGEHLASHTTEGTLWTGLPDADRRFQVAHLSLRSNSYWCKSLKQSRAI